MSCENASNEEIGKYLKKLIEKKYDSTRKFGRDFLEKIGGTTEADDMSRISNKLSQIINGKKGIQIYDLPVFSELLGVSYEEILSAGKTVVPSGSHTNNYQIASSKDKKVWKEHFNRKDAIYLNSDEYNKTILDYAIDFKNYKLIKYLIDERYLWLSSEKGKEKIGNLFGAGTSFKRRNCIGKLDVDLILEVKYEDRVRTDVIALAIENDDFEFLEKNHAREIPETKYIDKSGILGVDISKYKNERLISTIARADEKIIKYYAQEYTYVDHFNKEYSILFPFVGDIISEMISNNRPKELINILLDKALEKNKKTYEYITHAYSIEYDSLLESRLIPENDYRFHGQKERNDYIDDQFRKYNEDMRNRIAEDIKWRIRYNENNGLISCSLSYKEHDGIVANIIKINVKPISNDIFKKVEEINSLYQKILECGTAAR